MSKFALWARGTGAVAAWRSRGLAAAVLGAAAMLACWGGGAAAETSRAVLAFSPSPFHYGEVTLGHRISQTFTLTNSGDTAAATPVVTVEGSPAFAVTDNTCRASLEPAEQCTVEVQFAPTSVGPHSAVLNAVSQKPAATATDSLTGSGAVRDHVFWADGALGAIMQANDNGTDPDVISTGQETPTGVALKGSHLYWSNFAGIDGGSIIGRDLKTGYRQVIVGVHNPAGVAANSSDLYWINTRGTSQDPGGSLVKMSFNDTSHLVVLDHLGGARRSDPYGLALDHNYLYYTFASGTIDRLEIAQPDYPENIVENQGHLRGIAVGDNHLYWATIRDGVDRIVEANLDGSDPHTIASGQNVENPTGVAVNDGHLYWTNTAERDGSIVKANLDGTDQRVIITDQPDPLGLAVGP